MLPVDMGLPEQKNLIPEKKLLATAQFFASASLENNSISFDLPVIYLI
jgi:hypothetical protein